MMGELKFFFRIQINQCRYGIYFHQSKYTKKIMKNSKLEDCKLMATPMHLSKEDTCSKVHQKLYRGMVLCKIPNKS